MNKLDLIKTENFCSAKSHVKMMKRQTTYWEKMFANSISNKRLVHGLYKEPQNSVV